MLRPAIGLTDIFPQHGEAYRAEHKHPREHLRVMRLLETWRTATLGGHVEKMQSLRSHPYRVQLLPESTLPEVPRQ